MTKVSKDWIAKHGEAWDQSDRAGREYTLSLGNDIITLSDEENANWREAVRPVMEEFIQEKEAQGMPAEKYVTFLEKEIKKCK
jgi:hypothetical protein